MVMDVMRAFGFTLHGRLALKAAVTIAV